MKKIGLFTTASNARGAMALPVASADSTLHRRFPWLSASSGVVARPRVLPGDEFVAFADEVREWTDLTLEAGLENWPDDWSDQQT